MILIWLDQTGLVKSKSFIMALWDNISNPSVQQGHYDGIKYNTIFNKKTPR